jgi:cyclophilin family peptidyl-prolyl cis-trans isomerase
MNIKNTKFPFAIAAVIILLASSLSGGANWQAAISKDQIPDYATKGAKPVAGISEGPVLAPQIVVGPFDIHRKYRSMEGPWAVGRFKIGDLIASESAFLPKSRVHYLENELDKMGPAMSVSNKSDSLTGKSEYSAWVPSEELFGLTKQSEGKKNLFWFKGLKLEVLDEHGRVMPSGEFICHTNLDFSARAHNQEFPNGEPWTNDRLMTITQGQTTIIFPEGFGVPFSGDEHFRITFQAANRTSSEHRILKHRATFYFIKDSDLVHPITALYERVPYVTVIVDGNSAKAQEEEKKLHPGCALPSYAVNAPNNVTGGMITDALGRVTSGHWVVPPGVHSYSSMINEVDPNFSDSERKLRFAWAHVHPCCTEVFVNRCDGENKQKILSVTAKTDTNNGLELADIELLKSKDGILFPKGGHYEVVGAYNNTLSVPLDAMVTLGMFFEDPGFRRPEWSLSKSNAAYCGVTCSQDTVLRRTYPLFDEFKDGPLLTKPEAVQVTTSLGKLNLILDPAMAPISATYIYRLLTKGAYNGTLFVRYDPNYVLQLGCAEDKAPELPALSAKLEESLRRLPLETTYQKPGVMSQEKFPLVMARTDDVNSGTSSFFVLLGPAPHLERKYTVFGKISDDRESVKTLNAIIRLWGLDRPVIKSTRKIQNGNKS